MKEESRNHNNNISNEVSYNTEDALTTPKKGRKGKADRKVKNII